jgi:molybdopterin-binding protein
MHSLPFSRVLLIATICLLAACATSNINTSNKWRMEFSGDAETDGTMVVQVMTVGAVIAEVPVQIAGGTSENLIAERVNQELKLNLPADAYDVEVDDGEDVLIKRRDNVADFEVRVLSNSVRGVRIDLEHE